MTTISQSMSIQDQIAELKQKIDECNKEIINLQKICVHTFKKVWKKLETNCYLFRVAAYRCSICTVEKRKENEGSHCYVCDGHMEYLGYIPGQGDGYHLQRCVECDRRSDSDYYGINRRNIPEGDSIVE